MDIPSKKGLRLKKAREESGLTQEELANFLGVSITTISHYELGKRNPLPETLAKLAEKLNVTIEYLIGQPDDDIDIIKIFTEFDRYNLIINENVLTKDDRLRLLRALLEEYFACKKQ